MAILPGPDATSTHEPLELLAYALIQVRLVRSSSVMTIFSVLVVDMVFLSLIGVTSDKRKMAFPMTLVPDDARHTLRLIISASYL